MKVSRNMMGHTHSERILPQRRRGQVATAQSASEITEQITYLTKFHGETA